MGEVVEKYEDPVETPTDGYMRLGIRSHAKGTFHNYVEKGKELETAKMFRVAANKFIVNITFGWEHAVAITDENDAGKYVSHRFPQYSFNEGMIPKFFRYLFLDDCFKHHLELSSPGGAGRNRVLKLSDMLEYKMLFPSENEQEKIASHFDDLDNLITLHQRKLENAKKLKKSLLQKMFPKEGELFPEIRFPDFHDAWEQRKLGDVTYLAGEKNKNNDYYESYSITNEHGFIPQDEKFEKGGTMRDADKSMYYIVSPNSFAYNPARINVGSIGYQNLDKNVIVSSLYEVFKTNDDIDDRFLWHWFKSDNFYKLIMQLQEGGVRLYFYYDKLCKGTVLKPLIEEQKVIGVFFDELDNLITLHQRKIEHLKKMKKSLLQQMFV